MEERHRKKDPCTVYKREGRTKQNVYEKFPPNVEFQGGCDGRNNRSASTNQNMYECCPPTPVELKCSVCYTAERDGCNLWTCVPFVSYSVLCGPTLADLLVHLLNLLPLSLLACLGFAHPRCCSAQPKPPRIICEPERTPPQMRGCGPPCAPVNPCPPVNRCPVRCPDVNRCTPKVDSNRHRGKRLCPDSNRYERGDDTAGNDDRIMNWMHNEYDALARELAEITRLTNENEPGDVERNRDLAYARNYVLDRLAEMLAKKEEIEKRHQQKMQNRLNN